MPDPARAGTLDRMHFRLALASALLCVCGFAAAADTLHIAAWNLEWLMSPESARDLRVRCRKGERRLPCDLVAKARSEADYRALARYAERLDADVVAVQEVEDVRALARVFPRHAFCLTQRRDRQNVGFAIRRGLPHRCGPDVLALSLDDRVRRGAELTLYPGDSRELHLLSVHLKAGCNRDALDSPSANCRTLARQGPPLAEWIDARVAAGQPYAVLGDFNRDLRADERDGTGLWARLADGEPRAEALVDAGAGTPFVACHAGQSFTRYIDFVLLGGPLAGRQVAGSFHRVTFDAGDARRFRLSDHCPLGVRVRLH